MAGIIDLYYKNIAEMRIQKKKIAYLQLTSKIEDYLVKEFAHLTITESSGRDFVLTNYGCAGKPRIDMCFITGDLENPYIFGMLEAKYIRNIHRISERDKAWDETNGSLNDLYERIGNYPKDQHCKLPVKLNSKDNRVYGLVFASHVTFKEEKDSDSKEFFDWILERAKPKFVFYDLKGQNPRFDTVYEREKVQVLNNTAYATLKVGLWAKKLN